jgi:hypothetical protein
MHARATSFQRYQCCLTLDLLCLHLLSSLRIIAPKICANYLVLGVVETCAKLQVWELQHLAIVGGQNAFEVWESQHPHALFEVTMISSLGVTMLLH